MNPLRPDPDDELLAASWQYRRLCTSIKLMGMCLTLGGVLLWWSIVSDYKWYLLAVGALGQSLLFELLKLPHLLKDYRQAMAAYRRAVGDARRP